MAEAGGQRRSLVKLLDLLIAFSGAIVSFLGATFTYLSQAQISDTPLWPLPGLVLVDWILMGSLGFIAVFFALRKASRLWLRATWVFTGSFIPLIILGTLSISPLVSLAFLLFILSTTILAIRNQTSWLASFGFLMIGSIGNLAVLMLIITQSGQTL